MTETPYGQEVIIDVHGCRAIYTRDSIERFCAGLCELLDMQREDLFFWDYDGQPEEYAKAPAHLKGTSAVQFIRTSNITIHALDDLHRVYVNVFSCKPFDAAKVRRIVRQWTHGTIVNFTEVTRI
jgi:S-adenosylmethionine/arginine decarboxylase-like enzyme